MTIKQLRTKIFNIIKEDYQNGSNEKHLLNVLDDFELPNDLEYTPSKEDIAAVEDTWGKGNFVDKPISGEEKEELAANLSRAKMELPNDEKELNNIETNLDKRGNTDGSVERRMKNLKMSAN